LNGSLSRPGSTRLTSRRTREVQDILERRAGLSSEPFPVDRFILFESRLSRHGAHYEEITVYPLG
jgi:2'-5' RNA ligase